MIVQVDNTVTPPLYYTYGPPGLQSFSALAPGAAPVVNSNIAQVVTGSGGMTLGAFDPSLTGGGPNAIFVPIFTLNSLTNTVANRSRMLVGGTNSLYESTNRGATFTSIGGVVGGAPQSLRAGHWHGERIAYGGTAAGLRSPQSPMSAWAITSF